ncbi:MAG: hypothetical protein JW934_08730 [Anaerolineae bacterium]|nr:hypothetical protein [Anaerolineae bacterium]
MNRGRTVILGFVLALILAACSAPTVAPDNESIVQTAVAATLTAGAARVTPTPTEVAQAVTATPSPPTSTPVPTETSLPVDESLLPTPTAEAKLIVAESDVDGNDGNEFIRGSSASNDGRVILLPGFDQAAIVDPPVFRDRIVFQVEVFDTRAGEFDGAGIERVVLRIIADDGIGEVIYEREMYAPPYCAFGGEPQCLVWTFADHGNRWPNDRPVDNSIYLASIDIVPQEGESTQWRWRFQVDRPQLSEPGAHITGIAVQSGYYAVDFEASGFEPVLPGQHVHFFFNTVPSEQAGMPGKGPWKLYPAAPGQPGSSPFTGYAVSERPDGATQMCVLVANPDHSVIQGTGNCFELP